MIDGLIGGKLHGKATQKTGQSGKPYVVAKVRTAPGAGDALFVNVIAFDRAAGEALTALSDGDSVCLSGSLTPKVWTPPNGEPRPVLDMVCHAVLTAYHVKRKRQVVQGTQNEPRPQNQGATSLELSDDLPWGEA